jgi:hypothetical protein
MTPVPQLVERLASYHPRIRVNRIQRGEDKGKFRIHIVRSRRSKTASHFIEGDLVKPSGWTLGFLAVVTYAGTRPNGSGKLGYEGTKSPEEIREELGWRAGRIPKSGVNPYHLPALEWLRGVR